MIKNEELLDYSLSNGHCLVPNQLLANQSLAEWIKRQQYQYKLKGMVERSSMTHSRMEALEKLGFIWNSHKAVWEKRYNELVDYNNKHGDTYVPSHYPHNPPLAIWVKRQRRQ